MGLLCPNTSRLKKSQIYKTKLLLNCDVFATDLKFLIWYNVYGGKVHIKNLIRAKAPYLIEIWGMELFLCLYLSCVWYKTRLLCAFRFFNEREYTLWNGIRNVVLSRKIDFLSTQTIKQNQFFGGIYYVKKGLQSRLGKDRKRHLHY